MATLSFSCEDAGKTRKLAGRLSPHVEPGLVVNLSGELGAGKTTFAQGLLGGREGVGDVVVSPTYTLVETYVVGRLSFCHLDLYRCSGPFEWLDAGISETLEEADVVLVEWPEKGEGLPACDALVEIAFAGQGEGRSVRLSARTKRGERWVSHLR